MREKAMRKEVAFSLFVLCFIYIYIYTNQAVYKAFPRTKGLKF